MRPPRALPSRRTAAALIGTVLAAGALSAVAVVGTSSSAGAAGTMTVYWRGNGHGHGMSQYGARGAALQGLFAARIVAFYYPGTTVTTVKPSIIRVRLTNTASPYTNVLAGTSGLKLSGYGTLPASGYSHFRLVPYGAGLALQGEKSGRWSTLKTGLPGTADFSSAPGWVQSLNADGSSTRYHGTIGAVRVGAGEYTINRVLLDQYVEGSVPREVPASWPVAAVRAQAIAARSYAEFSRTYTGRGNYYDICDTTSCQSYGGMAHYDASGHLLWTDDPDALINNANLVLRYQGAPVFAQYSASNGGATVDGGRPYLVGKTDPYDTAASGDPYLDESKTVSLSSLAGYYGLRSFSSIQVTKRDGHGPWGGRILSAYVNGTNSAGKAAHVATTGFGLGDAMGVGSDYLLFTAPPSAPSPPTSLRFTPGEAGAQLSWAPPARAGGSAITGYRVSFGRHVLRLPGSARSAWAGPLDDQTASSVSVSALNASGWGTAATVSAHGAAAPSGPVPLTPTRLFDTRSADTLVDPAHPYRFAVPGHGGVPGAGASSVQLTVSIMGASEAGVLTVVPYGAFGMQLAALAYRSGRMTTATISVPLVPSGTLSFRPSAGHLALIADLNSYTAGTGRRITTVPKTGVATIIGVPTGTGTVLDLTGLPGITSSTSGVLLEIDGKSPAQTWLRIWPDGAAAPNVAHIALEPDAAANTVVVPLPASHRLRMSAGARGAIARVALLGTLGPSGGQLVGFPPSGLADNAAGTPSKAVGTAPVTMTVAGLGQLPTTGVDSVLAEVTVHSSGAAGSLWAHPAGTTGSSQPIVRFSSAASTTATALIRLASNGAISLQSSVPGAAVSIDAIGYLTQP